MVGLPDGVRHLRIRVAIYTKYRRVTDRQTSCHGIVRAMHTRRAVKTPSLGLQTELGCVKTA